jgi:hypothetical protein
MIDPRVFDVQLSRAVQVILGWLVLAATAAQAQIGASVTQVQQFFGKEG